METSSDLVSPRRAFLLFVAPRIQEPPGVRPHSPLLPSTRHCYSAHDTATQRTTLPQPSREAAKECSPRRKPWVRSPTRPPSPVGAKETPSVPNLGSIVLARLPSLPRFLQRACAIASSFVFPQNDVTNNLYSRSTLRGKSWTMRPDAANPDSRKATPNQSDSSSNSLFRNILPRNPLFARIWPDRPESKMNKPLKINILQGRVPKKCVLESLLSLRFREANLAFRPVATACMPRLYGV